MSLTTVNSSKISFPVSETVEPSAQLQQHIASISRPRLFAQWKVIDGQLTCQWISE